MRMGLNLFFSVGLFSGAVHTDGCKYGALYLEQHGEPSGSCTVHLALR